MGPTTGTTGTMTNLGKWIESNIPPGQYSRINSNNYSQWPAKLGDDHEAATLFDQHEGDVFTTINQGVKNTHSDNTMAYLGQLNTDPRYEIDSLVQLKAYLLRCAVYSFVKGGPSSEQ